MDPERFFQSHELELHKKAVTSWATPGAGGIRGGKHMTQNIPERKAAQGKNREKGLDPKAALKRAGSVSCFWLSPQAAGHAGRGVGGGDF